MTLRREQLVQSAGALGAHYAAVDWAATPLGPVEDWPDHLVNALAVVLDTGFPASLFWGPQLVLLYNEAFVQLIGDKHPAALGSPCEQVFPEAWDTVGPLMHGVLADEGRVAFEDLDVPLLRRGFLEECFFTFSYSAVRGPDGQVAGVLDLVVETTRQLVDRRRLALLSQLAQLAAQSTDLADVGRRALEVLEAGGRDVRRAALVPAADVALPLSGDRPYLESRDDGTTTWARLPTTAPLDPLVLRVEVDQLVVLDEPYREFVRLLCRSLGSALSEVGDRNAERRASAEARSLAEQLQRSLLSNPPQPDDLEIAVRYQPAAREVAIGGDWYDAFVTENGTTTLVVGDVTGHDTDAAAAMAQLRNVLRGVAQTIGEPPEAVLTIFDQALDRLGVDILATAVLLQVHQDSEQAVRRVRLLTWSNAGHPPPVLVLDGGRAELLQTPPDPLLGLVPGTPRASHRVEVPDGSTILLYTDGLVERRGESLEVGLERLRALVEQLSALPVEQLCDRVLAGMASDTSDDDIALVALRPHAQH